MWIWRKYVGAALVLGSLGALGAVAACSSSGKSSACVPGETRACVGAAACNGGQSCLADGASWGACDCGALTDSGTPDAIASETADAPPASCALPTVGDALARVTNLVPATGRLDFCLKRADGTTVGPVFGGSSACPGGLLYKDSSASFAVPTGTYEVDLIRGGGACGGAPLAKLGSVAFDAGTTTNAIAMGDGAVDLQVKALRESAAVTIASKVRFVHALDGAPAQDFGLTTMTSLPATLATVDFKGVAFGTTSPAGSGAGGPIDANGYVDIAGSGATLQFGRANAGTTEVLDLAQAKIVSRIGYSLYAIGRTDAAGKPIDPRFPTELLLCNEHDTDSLYARCGNAMALDVAFDVVNTQLNGPFAPFEALRRPALSGAIAGLGGDVACVTEVWSEADKDAIVNGAKAKYPYAARFKADLTTPLDDATNQAGAVPPAPTTPPCDTAQGKLDFESFEACVQTNCAVRKGDPTSVIVDSAADCVSSHCGGEAVTLALGEPRCWDCATVSMFGRASFADTKNACETNPQQRYAFGGANGVVLLSRFPFDGAPSVVNLGSTDFRVSLIRAPIIVDGGARLDAYCTGLTQPVTGVTRPYVGDYGGAAPDSDTMWKNELLLQVGKVANQVAARSGASKKRTIVLGDWYTGPKVGALAELNVESFQALTARLPLALADGFTPTCTYCADNPILTPPGMMPAGTSSWSSYGVLSGVPITDVRSNRVLLRDAVVAVPMASYEIPVSPYYGFRTVVRVRP